jgi:hypothetical protein
LSTCGIDYLMNSKQNFQPLNTLQKRPLAVAGTSWEPSASISSVSIDVIRVEAFEFLAELVNAAAIQRRALRRIPRTEMSRFRITTRSRNIQPPHDDRCYKGEKARVSTDGCRHVLQITESDTPHFAGMMQATYVEFSRNRGWTQEESVHPQRSEQEGNQTRIRYFSILTETAYCEWRRCARRPNQLQTAD